MFPFRRGGGKKRGKPQGQGQGHQGQGGGRRQGGGGGGGRRIPNSAAELLGTLQPTTKSLAQVLAGNTRASGQVVHARNILTQAERLVGERAVDRLPPKQREEFLEQFARLKLTLADADDTAEAEAAQEEPGPVAPPVTMDRLRELALSLAAGSTSAEPDAPETPDAPGAKAGTSSAGERAKTAADEDVAATTNAETVSGQPATAPPAAKQASKSTRTRRGDTLRLKTTVRQEPTDENEDQQAEAVR
jgi:hypothetical protein